ncbi:MAG TPA: CRISPR-associated protein Csx14 [Bacillota bacterium]|nr:CRISPR-associated protein Csx14 [Bacillota bacterium]
MVSLTGKAEAMIATLGVEPQVVTIALDYLINQGKNIIEVTVLYTADPAILNALAILEEEFKAGVYPGISFHARVISTAKGPVRDFQGEEELRALLRTLYTEIRQARQKRLPIHLCISGGRKVMGVMAMTVAQLLFGPEDRVWYLITEGWKPGAGRQLHANGSAQTRLIPVPVLRWQEAGILMEAVTELDDPREMLAWYQRLTKQAEKKRQAEFIKHWLTPAERQVTELACRGYDNATIAAQLNKREQTVANQLRSVYEKLREWLGFPDYNVDRSVLIARFAPYFTMIEPREMDYADS